MKCLAALLLTVALVVPSVAGAAQDPGALDVRLVDPYDGPVAGAEVTAVSLSGYRQVAVTDPAGRAVFPALVPGLYSLDAVASFGRVLGDVFVLSAQSVQVDLRIVGDFSPGLVVRPVDAQGLSLPGARVTVSAPGAPPLEAVTDSAGVALFDDLRPGAWRVAASLPGFEGPPVDAQVAYAPPAVVEVPLVLAGFGETLVVTATRNPVRLVDAPVTTSALGADRIATAPASDVADMLRALPGVNVVRLSARDIALTNRGATTPAANSQLVLVDGRSVYLDFFGTVLWDSLSFNQADVRQIEVVRGPASATWGANAMTGAVNIVTRDPRESAGTDVSFWAGAHDRDAGSTAGMAPGSLYGVNATVTRAPTPDIAYRVSAGQSRTDAYPRPTGRIPSISDPRIAGRQVGGAAFPAIPNPRASQLKFDARFDQRVHGGRGRLSSSAGVARPQGVTHTALGPFDLSRGHVAYAKLNYDRDALSLQVFANFTDGVAPSQLLPDTELSFGSRSVDAELVHRSTAGRHRFTYGGNVRRAAFDVDLAALAPDRVEFAGFFQDELDTDRFRFVAAGRVDKFGNISKPFVSPRLALGVKLGPDHVVTGSYNRAFRAPSAVEAFLDHTFGVPIDLAPLEALRPFLPLLVPASVPEPSRPAVLADLGAVLDATVAEPFVLDTRAIGGSVPYYSGSPRSALLQESVDSYEVSYAGTVGPMRTAVRRSRLPQRFLGPDRASRRPARSGSLHCRPSARRVAPSACPARSDAGLRRRSAAHQPLLREHRRALAARRRDLGRAAPGGRRQLVGQLFPAAHTPAVRRVG